MSTKLIVKVAPDNLYKRFNSMLQKGSRVKECIYGTRKKGLLQRAANLSPSFDMHSDVSEFNWNCSNASLRVDNSLNSPHGRVIGDYFSTPQCLFFGGHYGRTINPVGGTGWTRSSMRRHPSGSASMNTFFFDKNERRFLHAFFRCELQRIYAFTRTTAK